MNRISTAVLALFIIFPLLISAQSDFYSSGTGVHDAELLAGSMDTGELLGQLFMVGFFGADPAPEILSWIESRNLGGVKIFGWNVVDLPTLGSTIGSYQKAAAETRLKIPLFIATDQEGGWVRHIKGKTSITPGNLSIGATRLPYDAYMTGFYIGTQLRTLGINMNFAPTVDVYTNPEADVIGPRSFSSSPKETAEMSVAFFQGQNVSGVISTAKHFPGHGNVTQDSHGVLPVIHTQMETLWNRELLPYRYLVKKELPAIMSGHLAFPEITGEIEPASLSHYFLTGLLREKMGFEGVIITDDMRMGGATSTTKDTPEACIEAIEAGNDIILISHGVDIYEEVWESMLNRMKEDPGFKEKVQQAVRRILTIKLKYLRGENRVPLYPDVHTIKESIPSPEAKDFFFNEACRSVTMIRDESIPLNPESAGKILIAAPYRLFLSTGKKYFPNADTFYFPFTPLQNEIPRFKESLLKAAANHDTVIFSMANRTGVEILEQLKELNCRVIVISSLTPVYLKDLPWIKSAIAVYGTGQESFTAGFSALLGSFKPEGTLPIPLDKSGYPSE